MNAPNQPGQQVATRNLGQMIANLGPQSALAGQSKVDPRSLAAGIKPSFATVTFKGKTWGIRHRGVTNQLLARDAQGNILGAIPTIDVVIVKVATPISKSYYIDKYKEGDFKQPDCWSTNGVTPDTAAPHRQSPTCRGCKWDSFGSRTMDDGRKGKACSDGKRIAVVPAADIKNEMYGGPMLMKLPPSAFNGLSELDAQLQTQGYVYWGIVMRLSFDFEVAFPKIVFTPIRVLNEYEQQGVLDQQNNEVIDRILNEELVEVSGDPEQPVEQPVEPPPVTPVVTPPRQGLPVPPAAAPTTAFNPSPPPVTTSAPVTPSGNQGAFSDPGADPGPLPAHLNRLPTTNGAAPPVQQPAAETPEQKIARLEAQLAAATTEKPKARRTRTAPVTPGGVTVQQPAPTEPKGPPLPFTADAHPAQQQVAAGQDDDEGDSPADLDSKIDNLLKNA